MLTRSRAAVVYVYKRTYLAVVSVTKLAGSRLVVVGAVTRERDARARARVQEKVPDSALASSTGAMTPPWQQDRTGCSGRE